MKLQFVTALHGNEPLPMYALGSQGIQQVVGNPRALMKNQRFIDVDMNASFGRMGEGYEIKRAREVAKMLDPNKLVVDMHTFTKDSPPFCIVVDLKMLELARKTGVKRVVYMKHNVKKGHALINHFDGISIEMGTHKNVKSFEQTLEVVKNLSEGKKREIELYKVYGVIDEPGNYANFELYKNNFYPVLSGKEGEGNYGLKARKVDIKRIGQEKDNQVK